MTQRPVSRSWHPAPLLALVRPHVHRRTHQCASTHSGYQLRCDATENSRVREALLDAQPSIAQNEHQVEQHLPMELVRQQCRAW